VRILLAAVCVASYGSGFATTVIAVRTPAAVVIAPDSMASGGTGFRVKADVCKIRRVGDVVFASAGFMANLPLQIDVYRIAQESACVSCPVREYAQRFTDRFLPAMAAELRWAKEHDAEAWAEYQRAECFQAVFAGVEQGVPSLVLRTFRCAADFQGRPFVVPARSMDCPGDCDESVLRYIPLGAGRAVKPAPKFWREHEDVAGAARFLVEEQMRASSDRVGGSITVVRITAAGVTCVECSSSCGSLSK
jgi:hypothetical protein